MADLGYPIAEVAADGGMVITKPAGTGGRVDRLTVTEQLLYEIHDPSAYLAPDVVLDLTGVTIEEVAPDRVARDGARGKPRPDTLKATVCIDGGVLGEAEISYAGPNAAARARLAAETSATACAGARPAWRSASMPSASSAFSATCAARLRGAWALRAGGRAAAVRRAVDDSAEVELLLDEVEALYCAGPAGGCRRPPPHDAAARQRFLPDRARVGLSGRHARWRRPMSA